MTQIADIADRLRRLAKRREDDGIYTDATLCDDAARALQAVGPEPVAGLSLSELQRAHIERQEEWCPDQKPDLSFRGNEMAGEVGEACNVIKKLERERHGWRGSRATKEQLAEELADVIHTAVLCSITAGIDIETATIAKFDATSEKNDLSSRIRSALVATPPAEQHPDDIAVDCFAAAMKAKLKWEREERNRSGWQDMTAADLSRLLYEHLPKGDPIDVANLVMMLHQNGQQIEAPATTTDERAVEALRAVIRKYWNGRYFSGITDRQAEEINAALAQGESRNG